MKKKLLIFVLKLVFAFAFLGFIAWYVIVNWHEFSQLEFVSPWLLLPAALLAAANIYSVGSLMDTALEPLGVHLSRREILGLSSLNRFCNFIAPGYLGAAVRAAYLKKTYRFKYADFISSFVACTLVLFLISAVVILLAFVLLSSSLDEEGSRLAVLFGISTAFLVALLMLPFGWLQRLLDNRLRKRHSKVVESLATALKGFTTIRAHKPAFFKMSAWVLVNIATFSLLTYFLYQVLGFEISIFAAVFITTISNWARFFSITPGNLGIKEGLMVVAAQIVGVPVAQTLVVAVLQRLIVFGTTAVLASYYGPKLLNTSLFQLGSFKKRKSTEQDLADGDV